MGPLLGGRIPFGCRVDFDEKFLKVGITPTALLKFVSRNPVQPPSELVDLSPLSGTILTLHLVFILKTRMSPLSFHPKRVCLCE